MIAAAKSRPIPGTQMRGGTDDRSHRLLGSSRTGWLPVTDRDRAFAHESSATPKALRAATWRVTINKS